METLRLRINDGAVDQCLCGGFNDIAVADVTSCARPREYAGPSILAAVIHYTVYRDHDPKSTAHRAAARVPDRAYAIPHRAWVH